MILCHLKPRTGFRDGSLSAAVSGPNSALPVFTAGGPEGQWRRAHQPRWAQREHPPLRAPRGERTGADSDGDSPQRHSQQIGVSFLEELLEKEPSEVAITLASSPSLEEALSQAALRPYFLELLLRALRKACTSRTNRQSIQWLLGLVKESAFLGQGLPQYVAGMLTEAVPATRHRYPQHVGDILALVQELVSVFPASTIQSVAMLMSLLQASVNALRASEVDFTEETEKQMEQAQQEGADPYGDVLEDEELGSRGNRDVYWSEADRRLLGPCLGLVKAAKACLKKVLGAVRAHGQADAAERVAQLDDLADMAADVSPSVDELALSTYPPVNQLSVRLNAAKLASVLKKMLEIARSSHVCPPSEEGWVKFLLGAVDHNLDRIKSLTQSLV
uniref:Cyclin-D1-binding protein 1-like C-terminal domain-containing protein n=1 Tax=Anolis carolinensis TaxID=28377 RepID=A0A803TZ11_ANOCA